MTKTSRSWRGQPVRPCVLAVSTVALILAAAGPAAAGPDGLQEFDRVLATERVGDVPLEVALSQLEIKGCLAGQSADLGPALDSLRGTYQQAVAGGAEERVSRAVGRRLQSFSADGALLTAAWLDSPEEARRRLFCLDGLPPTWIDLPPAGLVDHASAWFELSVHDELDAQRRGGRSAVDSAMRLSEERGLLVARFEATHGTDAAEQESRQLLEARLAAVWTLLVTPALKERADLPAVSERPAADLSTNPFSGSSGEGRSLERAGDRSQPRFSTSSGADLPDPRTLRRAAKTHRGWMGRLRTLRGRADELGVGHDLLYAEGKDPAESDRLVQGAEIEAALALLLVDIDLLEAQIQRSAPDSGVLRSLLATRAVPHSLSTLSGLKDDADLCLARLTTDLRSDLRANPLWLSSPDAPPSLQIGNTLPEGWETALDGVGPRQGPRVYEGPLLAPSPRWSDRTVSAVLEAHPSLDGEDARILLELIAAVAPELGGAPGVELAVRSALGRNSGLVLAGGEATLSELWDPDLPSESQPTIRFELQGAASE